MYGKSGWVNSYLGILDDAPRLLEAKSTASTAHNALLPTEYGVRGSDPQA